MLVASGRLCRLERTMSELCPPYVGRKKLHIPEVPYLPQVSGRGADRGKLAISIYPGEQCQC